MGTTERPAGPTRHEVRGLLVTVAVATLVGFAVGAWAVTTRPVSTASAVGVVLGVGVAFGGTMSVPAVMRLVW